jgi:cytochrome c oxidase subunit 4
MDSRAAAHLWRRAALVWLALTLALAATVAGAFLEIGAWKLPLALLIAAVKAGLVAGVFMELARAGAGARIAALVGLMWLALMLSLTFADEGTRQRLPEGFTAAAD